MSELKGQILGIILVIVMFGAIGIAMKEVFTESVTAIGTRIENAVEDMK